ncbi:hypothetical protein PENSPDRAFT_397158 [Peniophora sp. CONT]|nr:hypothetical protein PENSPDRAFT_397158 [Peniophora sp. CONT]
MALVVCKHFEPNRKNKVSKFRIIFIDSRIHRLARYYKTKQQIRFCSSTTRRLLPPLSHAFVRFGHLSGCLMYTTLMFCLVRTANEGSALHSVYGTYLISICMGYFGRWDGCSSADHGPHCLFCVASHGFRVS